MAASIWMWMMGLALIAPLAAAQSVVTASNSTDRILPPAPNRLALALQDVNAQRPEVVAEVLGLTDESTAWFQQVQRPISGSLRLVDTTNYQNTTIVGRNRIAYISCDREAYPGNINADAVLTQAVQSNVTAIILYSTFLPFCEFRPTADIRLDQIAYYTMTDVSAAVQLKAQLNATGDLGVRAYINRRDALANGSNSFSGGNLNGGVNPGGPSPSTAVAMIILYSITGVITALFLIIIVTGAIRAHRHPNLYGPGAGGHGRPRQSRARGLARAMLDTLPIVKFGDRDDPNKPPDVELAQNPANPQMTREGALADNTPRTMTTATGEAPRNGETNGGNAAAGNNNSTTSIPHIDESGLGCSICTEDFERGQDMRVLPCNHTFHPACIDPWLLNVSGTCPLCRIDLRPATSRTSADMLSPNGSRRNSFAPPLDEHGEPGNRTSRRLSSLWEVLNPLRMQDASTQERIAALRQVRQRRRDNSTVNSDAASGEEAAETRRTRRLTARFQETFHIRTRHRGSPDRSGTASRADGMLSPTPEARET